MVELCCRTYNQQSKDSKETRRLERAFLSTEEKDQFLLLKQKEQITAGRNLSSSIFDYWSR